MDCFILLFLVLIWLGSHAKYNCIKPNIEITVAPVSKKLQVNWEIESHSFRKGDWIGLYHGNTDTNNPNHNRKYVFQLDGHKGWATSDIKFNEKIPKTFKNPVVLQWRAIYWRNHHGKRAEALVTTKLSTFPNWMEYYWSTLHKRALNEIFIPGTHDSVCDENIDIKINAGTVKPKKVSKMFGSFKNIAVQAVGAVGPGNKLTMTQDKSILKQLLLGIRYLDIRVILGENKEYWGGHGGVKVVKMDHVIDQVKEFIDNTQKEIVIFDLHQFMEINNENQHKDLIAYLKNKFNDNGKKRWIPPEGKSWKSTLEGLLNNPNRGKIIISYNNHNIVNKFGREFLWNPVKQLWGDKNTIGDLIKYLQDTFIHNKQPRDICHAAMAQLTPKMDSFGKIVGNLKIPLNQQAEINAKDIYSTFMRKDVGLKTNILAEDYFMGQGTIRQAFIWNRRKFQSDQRNKHCDPREAYLDEYYQHNIIE